MYKYPRIILAQLILLLLTSCGFSRSFFATQTPTPDWLKLFNDDEFDACQLLNITEIETEFAIDANSDESSFDGANICRYFSSKDNENILSLWVFTDATLRKDSITFTASQYFDYEMKTNIKISQHYGTPPIQDIPDIGDKAYYVKGTTWMEFHFLKRDIAYAILIPSERHMSFEQCKKIVNWVSKQVP